MKFQMTPLIHLELRLYSVYGIYSVSAYWLFL